MLKNKEIVFLISRLQDILCLSSLIEFFVPLVPVCIVIYINEKTTQPEILLKFAKKISRKTYIATSYEQLHCNDSIFFIANPYLGDQVYEKIADEAQYVYIPYGNSISGEDYSFKLQYGKPVHNLASKIYTISAFYSNLYFKANGSQDHSKYVNIKTTPKFDHARKLRHMNKENENYTFVWNIHPSIFPTGQTNERTFSAFFYYYQTIYRFLSENKHCKVVLRPHPRLFSAVGIYINKAMQIFNKLRNFSIEDSNLNTYEGNFSNADCFITDLSSLVFDCIATEKPIISLFYPSSCKLNDFGQIAFNNFTYKINTPDDLMSHMKELANRRDPQLTKRNTLLHEKNFFDFSRSACELIYEDLCSQ